MHKKSPSQLDYQIHLRRRTFDPRSEPITRRKKPKERVPYLVQFTKPLTPTHQRRLRSLYGLRLTDYVPNFAYLEQLDIKTLDALVKDRLYRASALYQPTDKISPQLDGSHPDSVEKEMFLRVSLFPDVDVKAFVAVLSQFLEKFRLKNNESEAYTSRTSAASKPGGKSPYGMKSKKDESASLTIKILDDRTLGGQVKVVFVLPSAKLLIPLASRNEVRWIEEVTPIKLDGYPLLEGTPAGLIQSGYAGRTPIWNHNICGAGQVVGIIDESINYCHCLFRDNYGAPVGPLHRKVVGMRPPDVQGNDTHGQTVSAIAVGGNVALPETDFMKGIAFEAKLSWDSIEALKDNSQTILLTLNEQRKDQAFIHSNSWHDETPDYNQMATDVDTFVWENENHFVCGSSANSDGSKEVLGPPGIAKNVLCVSASGNTPYQMFHGDGLSGPTADDKRRKPEICAPGCNITTAGASSALNGCGIKNVRCASSWATAVIAGAAALVRQYYLEGWFPTGRKENDALEPSAALVKATLLNSTVDMTEVDNYPSNEEGWGLVQLSNALYFAEGGDTSRKLFVFDRRNTVGLHTNESQSHIINVKDSQQPLKVTLVWSDAPAQPMIGKFLINDLDLIVTSPDGTKTFFGNEFAAGVSQPGSTADTINNVEMILIKEPPTGDWTITVQCTRAPVIKENQGQGYALVVTGAI